jgi:hypothetical protein
VLVMICDTSILMPSSFMPEFHIDSVAVRGYARQMARLKLEHGSRRRIPAAMERVRKERMGKGKGAKRGAGRAQATAERPEQEAVFLPSNEHLVKMIAMQGADDEEIARMFGVPYEHFRAWRKLYPSFNDALNEGRLSVDAEVTYALYKQTQGFEYDEQTATPKGGVVTVKKFARPDTSAQKYWLENRRPDLWRSASTTRVTGKDDDTPVGMKVETRNDLIDSIVNLIAPKPDGKSKPEKAGDSRPKA